MANACDVAAYILAKHGDMSAMKLQKLVYYSQAWHSVWSEQALFENRIEAWANGPVVPSLYEKHKGQFIVTQATIGGDPGALEEDEADTIDRVLDAYASKSPQWLSDLTHMERPWLEARAGIPLGERGNGEISIASMVEYYGGL